MTKDTKEQIKAIVDGNLMCCGIDADSEGNSFEIYYQIKDRNLVEELSTLITEQRADAVIDFTRFLVTKRNFDGTRYGFTKELVEEYLKEQNI